MRCSGGGEGDGVGDSITGVGLGDGEADGVTAACWGPAHVTIWIATDGQRLYVRSGEGLRRHWPQNLLAKGWGLLRLGKSEVKVKPRHLIDPVEARTASELYKRKYGPFVRASKERQPLTL